MLKSTRFQGVADAQSRLGQLISLGRQQSPLLPALPKLLEREIRPPKWNPTLPLQSLLENLLGHAALAGRVDPATTVLCMDSHQSFLEMGKMLGVATNIFVTTKAKSSDFYVQNVNSYHERLKTWIDHNLHGVASKYIPSYLARQRLKTWGAMSSWTANYQLVI